MNTHYWDRDILYTLLNLANLEDGFFWGLEVRFWFGPLFPWVQWVCEVLMGPQQCCVSHRINTCDLSIQVTVFKSLLIGKASVISWDVFHLWWRPSVIFYCSNDFFFLFIYFWPEQAHGPTVTILWIYMMLGSVAKWQPEIQGLQVREKERWKNWHISWNFWNRISTEVKGSKWKSNQIIFVSIFTCMLNFDLLKNIKTTIVNFIAMYVHTYVAKFFLRQSFKLSKIIK